jgi:hypothetical protein
MIVSDKAVRPLEDGEVPDALCDCGRWPVAVALEWGDAVKVKRAVCGPCGELFLRVASKVGA